MHNIGHYISARRYTKVQKTTNSEGGYMYSKKQKPDLKKWETVATLSPHKCTTPQILVLRGNQLIENYIT